MSIPILVATMAVLFVLSRFDNVPRVTPVPRTIKPHRHSKKR